MRKYLMITMLAAVGFTALTICSSHDLVDPDRPEKDAYQLYSENFKAYVGGSIHPNQKWGFDQVFKSTKATTRAKDATIVLNSGYNALYDRDFMNIAMKYFPEDDNTRKSLTPKADVTSWEFHMNTDMININFICSNTKAKDEIGLYYYDPATETPEQAKKFVLIKNLQDGLDPYYLKEKIQGKWESANTYDGFFEWKNGNLRTKSNAFNVQMESSYYFGLYVTNHDTGKTYYTNLNLNEDKDKALAAVVGVDGDALTKELADEYVFGLSDDDEPGCELIFDIWKDVVYPEVVKQEYKPEPVLNWYRIIAEDLNAHDLPHDGLDGIEDDTDFDFNDIVLDVAIDQDGKAHCILQAAGATLKIKINNDETLEVHKLFGVEQGVMVNTNAEKRGMKGASKPPVEFTLDGPFQAAKDVKIHVYRQNNWMELVAPEKQAACKIAVGTDFVWPDERVSLKEVYPDFPNYVKDNVDVTDWWQKNTQKK